MERVPRRAAIKKHTRACLLAAGLALFAFSHANPFASPQPTPPPAPEIPLPPEIIDQLPPLPAPSLNAPTLQPEPTPEERLAELLPQLAPPTITITPTAPSITLEHVAPTYRPTMPAPTLLTSLTTHATALVPDPTHKLKQALSEHGVQVLAVLLSGTPRAIIQFDTLAHVIPYGNTLPDGNTRITAIHEAGVVLTLDGVSIELPLGEAQ